MDTHLTFRTKKLDEKDEDREIKVYKMSTTMEPNILNGKQSHANS